MASVKEAVRVVDNRHGFTDLQGFSAETLVFSHRKGIVTENLCAFRQARLRCLFADFVNIPADAERKEYQTAMVKAGFVREEAIPNNISLAEQRSLRVLLRTFR